MHVLSGMNHRRDAARRASPIPLLLAAFANWACQATAVAPPGGDRSATSAAAPARALVSEAPQANADLAIEQAIADRLRRDTKLEQTGLTVAVKDGIVELTGTVENSLSKARATRIAEAVRGVRSVDNRSRVEPTKRADADVERDVRKALLYNAATSKMPIHAVVRNGVARLTGTVSSWQEQRLAERIADDVRGVRFTQNDLSTKLSVPRADTSIAGDVQTRLAWDVLTGNDRVFVAAKGSRIVLTGTVGSAVEKASAIRDSYVPGVDSVDADGLLVDVTGALNEHWQPAVVQSDQAIAAAIRAAESYDPRVKTFNLDVSVADGVATLRGTVDTLNAKLTAEAVARSTVGVRDVKNQLAALSQQALADSILAGRVNEALLFDPITNSRDITATAKGGYITLSGTASTRFEKAEAFDVASRMAGVVGVINRLRTPDQAVPYVYSALTDP
ncbi:MAG TPA: BON domain-containing protein, partial [Polyangiaceae bacterium]|nr:BON domain-containing protein [Polyangiaceae bacterium]